MTSPIPHGGISDSLRDADDMLPPMQRWLQLAAIRAIVGSCRDCGTGDLYAVEPSEHDSMGDTGSVTWYETRCGSCGKQRAAPNGRVFRRSTAHRETPRGWLEKREKTDAETRRAGRPAH